MTSLKKIISRSLINLPGWHTNRKIVVIESDDWGSIRMPSKEVYDKFIREGYPVDLNPYERYDSLASEEDLELLFSLLTSFTDRKGNHPVITANCVVANPDFEKIRNDDFQNYHYELITETFKKYPKHKRNFELWKQGKEQGIFHPQFHAREHLNVSKFMNALQKADVDVHFGFMNQMPGCIRKGYKNNGNYFVEATHYESGSDKENKLEIYLEGLKIFKDLFGYESQSIIPPNYTWSRDYNNEVSKIGVKYIQGIRKYREPSLNEKPKYIHRFSGQKTTEGQINLVRNCFFEPSITNQNDPVDDCLSEIDIAFRMHKPAIISSHRINYVGFIDPSNRDTNLRYLNRILKSIEKKWPDVEFLTSDRLGNIIEMRDKLKLLLYPIVLHPLLIFA